MAAGTSAARRVSVAPLQGLREVGVKSVEKGFRVSRPCSRIRNDISSARWEAAGARTGADDFWRAGEIKMGNAQACSLSLGRNQAGTSDYRLPRQR